MVSERGFLVCWKGVQSLCVMLISESVMSASKSLVERMMGVSMLRNKTACSSGNSNGILR